MTMKSNRRQFFQTMGTGAAGLPLGPAAMSLAASLWNYLKKGLMHGSIQKNNVWIMKDYFSKGFLFILISCIIFHLGQ